MAREIVVWCDPCMGRDERTPGREVTVGLGGKQRIVALCDADFDALIKPVEALLEEFGAPPVASPPKPAKAAARPAAGVSAASSQGALIAFEQSGTRKGRPAAERPAQCYFCPLAYAGESSLQNHMHEIHKAPQTAKEFYEGLPCPICGKEGITVHGAHNKRAHAEFGLKSVTQGFYWARDNGDPHGAWAALSARYGLAEA